MEPPDSSNTISAVDRLQQEIATLAEEQAHALQKSIYVGMTTYEAEEYDERRKRIKGLLQELAAVRLL
jgi:hypothetical protein